MRAWTVDADDIRVAEDFDESLLHRTPEIDADVCTRTTWPGITSRRAEGFPLSLRPFFIVPSSRRRGE